MALYLHHLKSGESGRHRREEVVVAIHLRAVILPALSAELGSKMRYGAALVALGRDN